MPGVKTPIKMNYIAVHVGCVSGSKNFLMINSEWKRLLGRRFTGSDCLGAVSLPERLWFMSSLWKETSLAFPHAEQRKALDKEPTSGEEAIFEHGFAT